MASAASVRPQRNRASAWTSCLENGEEVNVSGFSPRHFGRPSRCVHIIGPSVSPLEDDPQRTGTLSFHPWVPNTRHVPGTIPGHSLMTIITSSLPLVEHSLCARSQAQPFIRHPQNHTVGAIIISILKMRNLEFPCGSVGYEPDLVSVRLQVLILNSLSGLRIWRCHKLCCRPQMRLRSCVAVAVVEAGSCSSNSTPSLGTSICRRGSPKKIKK